MALRDAMFVVVLVHSIALLELLGAHEHMLLLVLLVQ